MAIANKNKESKGNTEMKIRFNIINWQNFIFNV